MQKVNELEKEFRNGDSGPKYMFRGPNIDWGILVLKPQESIKLHYHVKVEETFYFVEGTPKMIVNDKEYRVKQGDAFRIEPGEKHDLINDTDKPIRAIIIKYPYLPDDKVSC